MPRALTICSTPACKELVKRGKCDRCRSEARKAAERRRPTASARGYDIKWRRTAGRFLKYHDRCECDDCMLLPRARRPRATMVHHRDGLGPGGPNGHKWFNLQAMTDEHHSKHTAREQPGGWHVQRS